ncbi:MAG: sulfate reduction electron transfer complex DsrMKJOP subunit DsrM [Spirochaetia bacterium]|nr:sulfate reduction electron transfer complex DsrMKJOP subunit DsrM [Spirochaetia bacterium]
MKIFSALTVVLILAAAAYVGVEIFGLYAIFGVVIPYFAFFTFAGGFVLKILSWAKSPTPFNITTTAGQQKSLKFIKNAPLENPSGVVGVAGRILLEVFFFRSLFRNTKTAMTKDNRPGYQSEKSLWLGGLVFHWSFFYIFIRHLRFFTYPVPGFVSSMETIDRLFQIGLPGLYLTDIFLLLSVTFLFFRRVAIPQIKYMSLLADYFPLFLIAAIGFSGIAMRYFVRTDVMGIKNMTMGLISFKPVIINDTGSLFYIHLFLVSSLFLYFPFSKLMHAGGIFMSPTRNLAGNSRKKRHINPWNYPVKTHSYEEYENDFRDAMRGAGLPLENPGSDVSGHGKQEGKE